MLLRCFSDIRPFKQFPDNTVFFEFSAWPILIPLLSDGSKFL